MDNYQSNTQPGPIVRASAEDLSESNGYLALLNSVGQAALPSGATDLALFVVVDGGEADADTTIQPLSGAEEVRIRAKGTGNAGDVLVLADPSTVADKGKVRALPATAGLYFAAGVAEEAFVDGQLVLVRPMPRLINVPSADSLTDLAFTSAGATGAEVEALRDAVLALMQAQGLVSAS